MANHAIVIGIDKYENPAFNLAGAVNDALRFTEWALRAGGVPEENLHLLLSPLQANGIPYPYREANRDNIDLVLLDFTEGIAQSAERLYFYFAGHGLSAAGSVRGKDEPVILPANFANLRIHGYLALGLSEVFSALSNVDPRQQYFFIDACRDFALEGIPFGPLGFTIPLRTDPEARSEQYVLFAASTGQRAIEDVARGQGRFAAALQAGLQGQGRSKVWSPSSGQYEVRFSTLVNYVATHVEAAAQRWRPQDWQQYVQIPISNVMETHHDPVVACFSREAVGCVPLRVRVHPSKARETCRVAIEEFSVGLGRFQTIRTVPPPAPTPLPCKFELSPGTYSLEVKAPGYEPRRETVDLFTPAEREWQLQPPAVAETADEHKPLGTLRVRAADQSIPIIVWDAERRPAQNPYGDFLQSYGGYLHYYLTPGYYYVAGIIPGEPIRERLVEVLAGENPEIFLDSPPPQIGSRQLDLLAERGIVTDDGSYLYPSEALSGVTKARLASLLSFAAFAAIAPHQGMFKLKSLGLEQFATGSEGDSGLLVVLGVGGDRPTVGVSTSRFLRDGQLALYNYQGQLFDQGGFDILSGFPDAAQRRLPLVPGALIAEFQLPGFKTTRYALHCLPKRVTILVLVVEEGGEIAAQQFLFPIQLERYPYSQDYLQPAHEPGRLSAANLQRLEMAQRFYINNQPIPAEHIRDLLFGKWIDPLLGCLAGYSVMSLDHLTPAKELRFEKMAMDNMLHYFGALADSHILAGLFAPEQRDTHFADAVACGLPLFAEGFRLLKEWHAQNDRELPLVFAEAAAGFVFTSPWTTWIAADPD